MSRKLYNQTVNLELTSLEQLAHYSRLINIERENSNIFYSPDFLLKLKKGNIIDRAILMCCLFMGCKGDGADLDYPLEISLKRNKVVRRENRCFVALGTNKDN